MGSKKQRAKLVKAPKTTSMSMMQPATAGQAHGDLSDEAAVRCHCDACTKPPSQNNNSDSPFLRMPREVRDKIYEELLLAKNSPENQTKIDEINQADSTPFDEFGRENALEYFDDTGIMPGSDKKYPFIVDAMGLLLANKQIHAEANAVLFSKNTFVVLVEWERVHCFWRCERPDCHPPGTPCFIMLHNLLQIKHLYVMVTNTRALKDPMLKVESATLHTNLKTVVGAFKHAGNKLTTLKLRYTSCFEGQIEAMRDDIEGPARPGMPERPVMLKDKYGKYHRMSRAEANERLFTYCNILNPLRHLKGVAEDVKIRGDLPGAYIDELTAVLSVDDPMPAIKKKRADEEAAKQARRQKPDAQGFWAELFEKAKRKGDEGQAKLCAQMMRTSVKSPAVMADLAPTNKGGARSSSCRPCST